MNFAFHAKKNEIKTKDLSLIVILCTFKTEWKLSFIQSCSCLKISYIGFAFRVSIGSLITFDVMRTGISSQVHYILYHAFIVDGQVIVLIWGFPPRSSQVDERKKNHEYIILSEQCTDGKRK
jgi:hypothetical protein